MLCMLYLPAYVAYMFALAFLVLFRLYSSHVLLNVFVLIFFFALLFWTCPQGLR